jgi:response regulator RpfG family c-di-GMP phosphodiesterase
MYHAVSPRRSTCEWCVHSPRRVLMSTISPPQLERMEAALTSHQDSAHFLELAEAYRRSGHLHRAVRVLQRGLENHPTSGAGFALLANVLSEEGRYAEALACWERLLELDPDNGEAKRAAEEIRSRLQRSRGVNGGGGTSAEAGAPKSPDKSTVSGPPGVTAERPGVAPVAAVRAEDGSAAAEEAESPRRGRVEVPPSTSASEVQARGPEETMPWESPAEGRTDNGAGADRRTAEPDFAAGTDRSAVEPERPAGAAERPAARVDFVDGGSVLVSELEAKERRRLEESAQVDSMAVAIADLLVGLLEYRDPFFRGGTSLTRLLTATIARQMGVDERTVNEIALGAVLRDLGQLPLKGLISKVGADLTEDAKRQVERHVDTALELLEEVNLPETVRQTIRHHHERWDGTGYPDRLAGEAIPLGGRIVAVADTFAAMIAARPHRLPKRVPAALDDIRAWSGTRYDPAVVDALVQAVATPTWRGIGFGLRHHLILADPDETRAMVLATRLCSYGYLAEASFSAEGALERTMRSRISGLIISADMPDADVITLLREIRETTRLDAIPIIITEAGVTQRVRLLEAGADVCLPRGSSFEELKATFEAFLRREGKTTPNGATKSSDASWTGLQGEIEEFPLHWLLQVLNYDARTAAVFIENNDDEGAIYLEKGHPRHAQTRTLKGEAAFRAMLQWEAGSFSVDPEASTKETTIRTPLMNLLLEQAVQEDHAAFFGSVRPEP